jgi:ribosomal protein RSM22 (predicted rRNA methylase)
MKGNNWCHFSQRLERENFQKVTKDIKLSYQDEKFSYIVFKRSYITPKLIPNDKKIKGMKFF